MDARARLLTDVFRQGFRTPDWRHNEPPPVVSLEAFFEGNTQPDSIAANIENHPGLPYFYEMLKKIRSRPDVQTVLVNIYDLSDIIFGKADGWPSAEVIHILTSADEDTVNDWGRSLLSDGAGEGWPYGQAHEIPDPRPGFKWWSVTWD